MEGRTNMGAEPDPFSVEPPTMNGGEQPTSIASLRRSRMERVAQSAVERQGPGVDTVSSFRSELDTIAAAVDDLRRQRQDDELKEKLGHLEKKLDAVADSAGFTEAYVSIEMRKALSEAFGAQLEAFQSSDQNGSTGRTVLLSVVAGCAFAMLGAEMAADLVTHAADGLFAWTGNLFLSM